MISDFWGKHEHIYYDDLDKDEVHCLAKNEILKIINWNKVAERYDAIKNPQMRS